MNNIKDREFYLQFLNGRYVKFDKNNMEIWKNPIVETINKNNATLWKIDYIENGGRFIIIESQNYYNKEYNYLRYLDEDLNFTYTRFIYDENKGYIYAYKRRKNKIGGSVVCYKIA